MPIINKYVNIDQVEREARKDYIDRHSPFIHTQSSAKVSTQFAVTVKMGNEYPHPDDFDHYIKSITLFNGEVQLASADFVAGALGGQGAKGHQTVTFHIVATGSKMKLVAHAYCTKHGIWESDPVEVVVEE